MKLHFENENCQKFVELKKTITQAGTIQEKEPFDLRRMAVSEFHGYLDSITNSQLTPEASFRRGKALLLDGDFKKAAIELNTAILSDSINEQAKGEACFYRGLAYRELREQTKADQEFQRAEKYGFQTQFTVNIYKLITTGKRMKGPGFFRPIDDKRHSSLNTITQKSDERCKAETFLDEYAKLIWYYREAQDSKEAGNALNEALEETLRPFTDLCKEFSETAKRKIRDIASKELLRIYEENKIIKGRAGGSPYISENDPKEGCRRIGHENETIIKIYRLYQNYTKLNQRQIKLNMASVFNAVEFWPSSSNPDLTKTYDLIDKRIKTYPKVSPSQVTDI